ncbi:MAG: tetratricopeptide repeat protein [Spirochaetales bacterium]|nr:tetratricopeptide repeat protein [Spirochaetales bacterium]
MLHSIKKYKYYDEKKYKRLLFLEISAIVLFVTSIIVLILALSLGWIKPIKSSSKKIDIQQLWKESNYSEIIDYTSGKLASDHFNYTLLTYRGLSAFYQSEIEPEISLKNNYINLAISDLRKIFATGIEDTTGKIDYALGKLYFEKGVFFYDQSIYHLLRSLDYGFSVSDINYMLGLAYSSLGIYEKSLEFFQKTLDNGDRSRLIIAVTEYNKGNLDAAYKYLDEIITTTDDESIKNACLYWIAKVYLDKKDYTNAIKIFNRIIKDNPKSADAYYYLGIIYKNQNNIVKARAAFRNALNINSSHAGAFKESSNL